MLQQQNGAEEQKKLAPIKATSYVCGLCHCFGSVLSVQLVSLDRSCLGRAGTRILQHQREVFAARVHRPQRILAMRFHVSKWGGKQGICAGIRDREGDQDRERGDQRMLPKLIDLIDFSLSRTRRWVKKHCQPGFNFDFERQACIAHTVKGSPHLHFRQFPSGFRGFSPLGLPNPWVLLCFLWLFPFPFCFPLIN